ncbi:MAG: class I SAM-dependent methyltransferase [Planctomycetota bacterium]
MPTDAMNQRSSFRWVSAVTRAWQTISLIIPEWLAGREGKRRPEPEVMEDKGSVEEFHAQGAQDGSMLPVFQFNAVAISRLLPPGGRLLDLGSGSGRFLIHLARCRPDIRIVGLDLSRPMVELGARAIREAGLEGRVRLEVGDVTGFNGQIRGRFDAISCIYTLHHLQDRERLAQCLGEIALLRRRWGCGVWIYDHARPKLERTARIFPEAFTPEASETFRRDSRNSLLASFSFDELTRSVEETLGCAGHKRASGLPLFQAHWLLPMAGTPPSGESHWREIPLPPRARGGFRQLRWIMDNAPGGDFRQNVISHCGVKPRSSAERSNAFAASGWARL